VQLQRLCDRTGLDATAAQQRINAQMPLIDKCRRATVVIDNMGSIAELQQTVNSVHEWLRAKKTHWKIRLTVASAVVFGSIILWTALSRLTFT